MYVDTRYIRGRDAKLPSFDVEKVVPDCLPGESFYVEPCFVRESVVWPHTAFREDELFFFGTNRSGLYDVVYISSLLEGEPIELPEELHRERYVQAFAACPGVQALVSMDRLAVKTDHKEVVFKNPFKANKSIQMAPEACGNLFYLFNSRELLIFNLKSMMHASIKPEQYLIANASLNDIGTFLAYTTNHGDVQIVHIKCDLDTKIDLVVHAFVYGCQADSIMFLKGNTLAVHSKGRYVFFGIHEEEGAAEVLGAHFAAQDFCDFFYNAAEDMVVALVRQERRASYGVSVRIAPFFESTRILIINPWSTNAGKYGECRVSPDLNYLVSNDHLGNSHIYRLAPVEKKETKRALQSSDAMHSVGFEHQSMQPCPERPPTQVWEGLDDSSFPNRTNWISKLMKKWNLTDLYDKTIEQRKMRGKSQDLEAKKAKPKERDALETSSKPSSRLVPKDGSKRVSIELDAQTLKILAMLKKARSLEAKEDKPKEQDALETIGNLGGCSVPQVSSPSTNEGGPIHNHGHPLLKTVETLTLPVPLAAAQDKLMVDCLPEEKSCPELPLIRKSIFWGHHAFCQDNILFVSRDENQGLVIDSPHLLDGGPIKMPLNVLKHNSLCAFGAYPEAQIFIYDNVMVLRGMFDFKEVSLPHPFDTTCSIRMAPSASNGLVYIYNTSQLMVVNLCHLTCARLESQGRLLRSVSLNEAGTLLVYTNIIDDCVEAVCVECDNRGAIYLKERMDMGLRGTSVMFLKHNVLATRAEGRYTFHSIDEEMNRAELLEGSFDSSGLYQHSYNADKDLVVALVRKDEHSPRGVNAPVTIRTFRGDTKILILDPTDRETKR